MIGLARRTRFEVRIDVIRPRAAFDKMALSDVLCVNALRWLSIDLHLVLVCMTSRGAFACGLRLRLGGRLGLMRGRVSLEVLLICLVQLMRRRRCSGRAGRWSELAILSWSSGRRRAWVWVLLRGRSAGGWWAKWERRRTHGEVEMVERAQERTRGEGGYDRFELHDFLLKEVVFGSSDELFAG